MFLSIIVPTLNEEKYLPILLASLASQTNRSFEVIVSEGRSEDKTKEKALEFKSKLNINVYDSDRKNLCHQRNLGSKKAKGNYLIFIDADHWVDNNFTELIVKELEATKAEVIIPVTVYHTQKLFWRAYSLFSNIFVRAVYLCLRQPFGSGSTVIIKKNVFDKIGGYDESIFYFEDHSLLQSAKQCGAKIRHSNAIKVYSSTRRMDKTGIWRFCYMHIVASFYFVFQGPIRRRIFEFEMGGQAHKKP